MARGKSPHREKAYEIWVKSNGEKKLIDIADELGVSDSLIRKWKSQDKWSDNFKSNEFQRIRNNVTNLLKSNINKKEEIVFTQIDEEADLTEKQRLFCLYYVKNFNPALAAIKAGYSPKSSAVIASRLLKNTKIRKYIAEVKELKKQSIMIDEDDILERFMRIAFADITDFVEFNKSKIVFKNSKEVDGALISEVKKSQQGVSIRLEDRQKALEWLANFFGMNADHKYRKEYDSKKIDFEKEKFEHQKKMDELNNF